MYNHIQKTGIKRVSSISKIFMTTYQKQFILLLLFIYCSQNLLYTCMYRYRSCQYCYILHVIVSPSKERIYIGIVPTSNPLTHIFT